MRRLKPLWPWVAIVAVLAVTAYQLHSQGRRWWCACGRPTLWSGDPTGPHNSQHLFDPYSFTHVLHGVVFCGLLAWACPRVALAWRLWMAICLASLWEVAENSASVIQRYRAATAAVGYEGDSIANSLGDILSCAVGFTLARRIGLRWSIVVFFVTEGILLLWIRDDLVVSVVMLIYPVPGIKAWQMGQ
jgi:hypothetical protein